MNFNIFKVYTDTNQWAAIGPEIFLGLLALALLALELFLPRNRHNLIGFIALAGQVLLLGALILGVCGVPGREGTFFSGMILISAEGQVYRIFFLLASCFVTWLGIIYLSRQALPKVEFFAIVLITTAALMLLGISHHFVMLFVALETVTVGFYVLVSYCRNSPLSLEAGLKYLILGALSSAILLFGIVLLYGVGGNPSLPGASPDSMDFEALAVFISANSNNLLVLTGAVMVIAGLAFKIGAFPFQIWVPDVYQGAPTPVTALLAVSSKAAGLFVLMTLVSGPFEPLKPLLINLLSVMAIVTILFGNLAALSQRNLKRLMGMSGIAHAGYLLIGVVALIQGASFAWVAIIFYLFAYLFASFGVFGVMAFVSGKDDEAQELEDYEDLAKSQPLLAAVLAISVGSLAGIPPLAGFIGKLLLFIAAFQAGLYSLLAFAVIGVVISIYYYFGWIREAYFHGRDLIAEERDQRQMERPVHLPLPSAVVLILLAAASVLFGVYQALIL